VRLVVLKNNVPIDEVLVETPDTNERYEIFVGRADDCHVLIDDPLISRHHFVITNDDAGWLCEKLTQLGVVLVNGSLAAKTRLNGGDEIKCGVYSIIVTDLSGGMTQKQESSIQMPPDEPDPLPVEEMDATTIMPASEVEAALPQSSPPEEEYSDSYMDQVDSFQNDNKESDADNDDPFGNSEGSDQNSLDVVEFGDSDSSLDSFGEDMPVQEEGTRFLRAFVNYQLVLFGEFAPYDRYQIDEDEVFIGRDAKKCQIVLNDPEVSSVHAVVRKTNTEVILEDLNSSNGTILNGERINRSEVVTGDEFLIGSTTFTLEVKSDLLDAESDRLMPVESGQVIETEEVEEELVSIEDGDELNFDSDGPPEKSIIKRIWKNPEQRKKAIYGLVAATLMFVLFYEETPEETKPQKATQVKTNEKPKLKLSKEMENRRNVAYELGVSFFEQNKYSEALREFQTVVEIDPAYKNSQTYLEQTKLGLQRLEELEAQKRAEEDRLKTKKIIEEILVKARVAVKERQVQLAENYFSQITEKDPENMEVQQLKMELELWQKEEQKLALERAAKEARRKAMVDALSPGKTYYLKKEWYRATLKLEEFLQRKGSDEDLVKEASEMLSESKTQLASALGPLLGKARSLKEGQDYKSAYEAFLEILKVEPTNAEALNEVDNIKTQLENRSKKIYREAIIAESLSLFTDAKEKFQEVQQISPTDSEYYRKASDKLKNYLE
jgi:pSer/pThr/pTyr-binding forkhead associated (FHA) protein